MFRSLLVLVLLAIAPVTANTHSPATGFQIEKVAPGVFAAIRTEPHGLTTKANSVFIINDDEVVVIDTTLTPSSAKELLAALRLLTNKPVKYVINTHWHDG